MIQGKTCKPGHRYISVGQSWWRGSGVAVHTADREGDLEVRCLEGDVTEQWWEVTGWKLEQQENLEQLPD